MQSPHLGCALPQAGWWWVWALANETLRPPCLLRRGAGHSPDTRWQIPRSKAGARRAVLCGAAPGHDVRGHSAPLAWAEAGAPGCLSHDLSVPPERVDIFPRPLCLKCFGITRRQRFVTLCLWGAGPILTAQGKPDCPNRPPEFPMWRHFPGQGRDYNPAPHRQEDGEGEV